MNWYLKQAVCDRDRGVVGEVALNFDANDVNSVFEGMTVDPATLRRRGKKTRIVEASELLTCRVGNDDPDIDSLSIMTRVEEEIDTLGGQANLLDKAVAFFEGLERIRDEKPVGPALTVVAQKMEKRVAFRLGPKEYPPQAVTQRERGGGENLGAPVGDYRVIAACRSLVKDLGKGDVRKIGLAVPRKRVCPLHIAVAEPDVRQSKYTSGIEHKHDQQRRMGRLAKVTLPVLANALDMILGRRLRPKIQTNPIMRMFARLVDIARSHVARMEILRVIARSKHARPEDRECVLKRGVMEQAVRPGAPVTVERRRQLLLPSGDMGANERLTQCHAKAC
jgi:hypothetical protein